MKRKSGPFSRGPRIGGPEQGRPTSVSARPAKRSPLSKARAVGGRDESRHYLIGAFPGVGTKSLGVQAAGWKVRQRYDRELRRKHREAMGVAMQHLDPDKDHQGHLA